jgi:hypothetical protein
MWCCLNPRAEVANDLYDFLAIPLESLNKVSLLALRNVVTVNEVMTLILLSYKVMLTTR